MDQWSGGRMNRTIKDATVKRYHYGSHDQLKSHLHSFLMAYNFARRLKTLKELTPYQFICSCWNKELQLFNITPLYCGTKHLIRAMSGHRDLEQFHFVVFGKILDLDNLAILPFLWIHASSPTQQ